jgi:hypothetical protein
MFGVRTPKNMRNNPPKAVRRGKSVQTTLRKPAKTTLAGKNVRGQYEITRQNHLRLLKKSDKIWLFLYFGGK